MSGLLFLTSEDFSVREGPKGNILCHGIPGFTLMLFYSTKCVHCQGLIPIFKKLPGTLGGCQFGMINISNNSQCVQMARNTIAPITYVPYILLYIDGRPYMVYKGPYDEGEIRRFVIEVANDIQQKQQFSTQIQAKPQEKSIPEYCIGKPVCGDGDVCYLDYMNAYN